MLPQSLPWLDEEFVQRILRTSESDESIEVRDVSVKRATAVGDNYLSEMIRAAAEYSYDDSGRKVTKRKSIIIKVIPNIPSNQDFVLDLGVFNREILMMEDTLVKMNEFLGEENIRLSARVLSTKNGDKPLIVMEDLNQLGYRMADRLAGLDLDHSVQAIKGLARFHAASVKLLEKEPEIKSAYQTNIYHSCSMGKTTSKSLKVIAELLEDWTELGPSRHRYAEKFAKLTDVFSDAFKACTVAKDNEFNVLNHGDCWTNNMLFRYNESGKVDGHIFVDFQLSVVSSPAMDLQYFINTSLQDDVEVNHYDLLLTEYLNTLTKTMTRIGCTTQPPDMESLKKMMIQYQLVAILASCIVLAVVSVEPGDAKSIDELVDKGISYACPGYKSTKYRTKMVRRIPTWDAHGVLDL